MNSASTNFATAISMAPTSSMDIDMPTQLALPTQLAATPCMVENKLPTPVHTSKL